jgi:two-component system LytT family response regulator
MEKRMRVLVVDDERRARQRLIRLLAAFDAITVAGEAENGMQAVEQAEALKPDAMFLDIQMPGMDGFEVLENLAQRPSIVFVTAYDRYAIQAFEANAVDYLLKPVEPERLARAVVKLRERRTNLDGLIQSRPPSKRLIGKRLQRMHVLSVESIEYFICENELVFAAGADGRFLLNTTLRNLETRLDPEQFTRVHKSAIVNLAKVVEIDPDSRSSGSVRLQSGQCIELSRRQAAGLRELLGW